MLKRWVGTKHLLVNLIISIYRYYVNVYMCTEYILNLSNKSEILKFSFFY